MKKGLTMILDNHMIARVTRGGTKAVTVQLESDRSVHVVEVKRLSSSMQPATDAQIFPGAELLARASTGGWIKVTVTDGDLRHVNRSNFPAVMVRDGLRGQTYKMQADGLMVDVAARLRAAASE